MNATARPDTAFLPDFCEQGNLLRTMLIAELLAIVLAAAQGGPWMARLEALALLSLFIQWVAVVDIALLCLLQGRLARLDDRVSAAVAFVLLQAVTGAFTLIAHGVTHGAGLPLVGRPLGTMLLEHGVISAIVSAVVLRYFYVTAQWRRNIEAEAQARVQALQARIRPHFLFNSMNTIASLTRTDAAQAESAVEDLPELFRASLAERTMLPLQEELALVASYLRIEQQRLGERLGIEWSVDPRSVQVVFALSGGLELSAPGADEPVVLREGETAVVPASTGSVRVAADADGEFIVAGLGGEPLVA